MRIVMLLCNSSRIGLEGYKCDLMDKSVIGDHWLQWWNFVSCHTKSADFKWEGVPLGNLVHVSQLFETL